MDFLAQFTHKIIPAALFIYCLKFQLEAHTPGLNWCSFLKSFEIQFKSINKFARVGSRIEKQINSNKLVQLKTTIKMVLFVAEAVEGLEKINMHNF